MDELDYIQKVPVLRYKLAEVQIKHIYIITQHIYCEKNIQQEKQKKDISSQNDININDQTTNNVPENIVINDQPQQISLKNTKDYEQTYQDNQIVTTQMQAPISVFKRQVIKLIFVQKLLKQRNFKIYLYKQCGKQLLIGILIIILTIILNRSIQVNCQFMNSSKFAYCFDKFDFRVAKIRELLFFVLGFVNLCQHTILDNIQCFQKTTLDIIRVSYFLVSAIMIVVIDISFQTFYNILYLSLIVYLLVVKFSYKQSFIKLLRRIGLNLIFFILWNIYIILIKQNYFELSNNRILLVTNGWLAIQKSLVLMNYTNKFKIKIDKFEDLRIQLLVIYLLDLSVGISVIMKSPLEDLTWIYFNILVMAIYNLTQLHLYYWIIQTIFKKISLYLKNRLLKNCFDAIDSIIQQFWIKYYLYLEKINKKLQIKEENENEINESLQMDIYRSTASYYVIASLYFYIYFAFILSFQTHCPHQNIYSIESTIHYNPLSVKGNQIIEKGLYEFTIQKYIIHLLLFIIPFVIVYFYFGKIEFFGMQDLNRSHIISQTISFMYLIFLIDNYSFM